MHHPRIIAIAFIGAMMMSGGTSRLHAQMNAVPSIRYEGDTTKPFNRWGIQFGISDNFRLTAFDGVTVSIRHRYSATRGFRLGLTVGLKSQQQHLDGTKIDDDRQSTSVSLQKLYSHSTSHHVSPYFAIGPIAAYTDNKEIHETMAGLSASIGIEWLPFEYVGVFGEYGSSLSYRYINQKTTVFSGDDWPPPIPPHRIKTVELAPDAVRLGISLYW